MNIIQYLFEVIEVQAIIETKQLQQAVKQAGKVAGKRSSMPILESVRIDAGLEGLTVSATNLEAWGRASVECVTQTDAGPNSVLVSASLLAKLAGKLPSGEVLLTAPKAADDESGVLTIGGAVIPTMELEDYPEELQATDGVLIGSFPGDVFKALVKRLKAASRKDDDTRRALSGINVIYGEGRVKLAATDGRRLLLEEFAVDCSESGAVLVDAADLARIATLVKASDVVTVEALPGHTVLVTEGEYATFERARLVVSFSSARYTLRGINEEFPDFERVIPSGSGVQFIIGRKLFASAIARGRIVADPDDEGVTLSIESGSSVLSMSSGCRELGQYREMVRTSETVWESCGPVAFNGSHVADVLKLGKSASVSVTLGDGPNNAALFSTDSDNVQGRTRQAWVLMPLNLDT